MATTLEHPVPLTTHVDAPTATGAGKLSPMTLGIAVMATSILIVFALTFAMILTLTSVGTLAAAGFAIYCASWLGPGFGAVFAGAIVFGREH